MKSQQVALDTLESLFSALADRTRLNIVLYLMEKGEANVDEISRELGKSQSLISHHISCLRNCGIVKVRKEGKYSFYSISSDEVKSLLKIALNHVKKYSELILSCDIIVEEKGKVQAQHNVEG